LEGSGIGKIDVILLHWSEGTGQKQKKKKKK
jgi:hypothetical protein